MSGEDIFYWFLATVFTIISVWLLVRNNQPPVIPKSFQHPETPRTNDERRAIWDGKYHPQYGYGTDKLHERE